MEVWVGILKNTTYINLSLDKYLLGQEHPWVSKQMVAQKHVTSQSN